MSTTQLQMLFSKHDNNHCAMFYKHWYMHGSSFKKQIFIEVVKANKIIRMKICSFSLKNPHNQILITIKLFDDLSKTFKSQVLRQMVGKNGLASKKTLFTSRWDLSPTSLLKDIWSREKFNIIKLVFFIVQYMRKYIWTRRP